MKFLILLLSMNTLLFTGDIFSSSKNTLQYKQIDKFYEESEISTKKNCDTCGPPAILLPYNGEDIPMAKTFPCPSIKGCVNTVLFKN